MLGSSGKYSQPLENYLEPSGAAAAAAASGLFGKLKVVRSQWPFFTF